MNPGNMSREMEENEYHWRRGGFKTRSGQLIPLSSAKTSELSDALYYFRSIAQRFGIRIDTEPLDRELVRRGHRDEYTHQQQFISKANREVFIPEFNNMSTKKPGTVKKTAPKKVTKKDGITKMFISINTDSQVKKWEDIAERVNDNMEGNIHLTIEEATEAKDKDYDYFYVVEIDIKSVKSDRITSAINLMDVKLS